MLAKMLFFALPLLVIFFNDSLASTPTYDVVKMGAKADGITDSTKAFLNAWSEACSTARVSTIYVPKGRFLLGSTVFNGQHCKSNAITIRVDGTLIAPSNYNVIGNSGSWIKFVSVHGVSIYGGILDGQGTGLWNCKASGKSCPSGAATLAFFSSNNILISGLTSINSQKVHIRIHGCQNTNIQWVKIVASGESPNTDGIHLSSSTGATIMNTRIGTGDDCISIGPGTSNVWIEKIHCGPGHGISIGSLGSKLQEPGVQNVTVKSVTLTGTQNGVRIKTWAKDSNGFVSQVKYQNISMVNVQNPIIIDQNYCPNDICPTQVSGVKISDVTYQDIYGTSATMVGVNIDCSKKYPCRGISLQGVRLTYRNKPAQASCFNVQGAVCKSIKH